MPSEQAQPQPEKPKSAAHDFQGLEQAYEAYADAMNVQVHGFTVTLVFGTREGVGNRGTAKVVLRMSPQFAKAVVEVLERTMKNISIEVQAVPSSTPQS